MLFFIAAAAGPAGINPTSIANEIQSFLPLNTLAGVVDQVLPIFDVLGVFLIIVATVQEVPKAQGGEFFNVILRAMIALAVMGIVTPLMWGGEVLVQNICAALTAGTGGNGAKFVGTAVAFTGFAPVPAATRAQILYNFDFGAMFNGLQAPQAPTGVGVLNIVDDAKWLLAVIIYGALAWVALFTIFVMTLVLYVQKAILIFGLLLMPPFIGLQTWQGSSRFLGMHYIQSMLGVLCWPLGWGFIYVGTVAAMKNLQVLFQQFQNNSNSGAVDVVLLIFIFVNFFLVCLWMIIGTLMAPGLMNKVVTAGGNFAAGAMGAVSGKAIGAVGDTIRGAASATGAVAGAAIGAAVAGPAGAMAGAGLGGQLGGSVGGAAAAPTDSVRNSIAQGTGEGGGGAAPSGASADAGLAALAQVGKGRGAS
jgi:hypothetical protein